MAGRVVMGENLQKSCTWDASGLYIVPIKATVSSVLLLVSLAL